MHKILCNCKSSVCHLLRGRRCHMSDAGDPLQDLLTGEVQYNCEICLTYCQPLLLPPSLHTHAQVLLSLPHKAAQRTSELNFFLYLRISGLSLCGRILVGLTLTTEPFLAFSLLTGSGFALDARMKGVRSHENCECLATSHILSVYGRMKETPKGWENTSAAFAARGKSMHLENSSSIPEWALW